MPGCVAGTSSRFLQVGVCSHFLVLRRLVIDPIHLSECIVVNQRHHPIEMAKVDNVHKLAQSSRSLQFPKGPAIWADEERFDLEKCLDDGLLRRSGDRMAKMRQTKEASALAKYCGALSKLSVVEEILEPLAEQVSSLKLR